MLDKFKEKLKSKKEVYLRIKARPAANKTEITDLMDDGTIKVDIKARPEKGLANKELTRFLAKEFSAEQSDVKLISGKSDRIKLIKINYDK